MPTNVKRPASRNTSSSLLKIRRPRRTNILIAVIVALILAVVGLYIVSRSHASSTEPRVSVQTALFCPNTGCGLVNQSLVQGWSNEVANWFANKLGTSYTNLPTITVYGSHPAAWYNECRIAGGCANPSQAIVSNLRQEFGRIPQVSRQYVLGYDPGVPVYCGWEYNLSSQDTTSVTNTGPGCGDHTAVTLAHETAHSMGLQHVNDGSLMISPGVPCQVLAACSLNPQQASWLVFNSPMFSTNLPSFNGPPAVGTFTPTNTSGSLVSTHPMTGVMQPIVTKLPATTKPAEQRIYGSNRFFGPAAKPISVPTISISNGSLGYRTINWTSPDLSTLGRGRTNWSTSVAQTSFGNWKLESVCYLGNNYKKCVNNSGTINFDLSGDHRSVFVVYNWTSPLPLGAPVTVSGKVFVEGKPAANEKVKSCYGSQKTTTDANGVYRFVVPANANYCVRLERDKKLFSVKATNSPVAFSSYENQVAAQACATTMLCPKDDNKIWDKATDQDLNFFVTAKAPSAGTKSDEK